MENQDPYDWSVDQVVTYLCETTAASSNQAALLSLAETLRENDISGDVLLTDIDKDTLKNEFQIKSFGLRVKVHKAILGLQKSSPKYAQFIQDHGPPQRPSYGPPTQYFGQEQQLEYASTPTGGAVWSRDPRASTPSQSPATPVLSTTAPPVAPQKRAAEEPAQREPLPSSLASQDATSAPADNREGNLQLRKDEISYTGADGKKRRRLDPSKLKTLKPSDHVRKPAKTVRQKPRYLAQQKMSLHDVFYGDQSDSDEDVFVVQSNGAPTGHRLFVNRALRRFQRQVPEIIKDKQGNSSVAIFPYRDQVLAENARPYFTLISKRDGKHTLSKEALVDWPELNPQVEDPFLKHLERKYCSAVTEDALPVYGESGSEDEYDSDTLREIEEERGIQEGVKESQTMDRDLIDRVMDDCISSLRQRFAEKRLAILERKARGFWIRSRRQRSVGEDMKRAGSAVSHLTSRINKMRSNFHLNQWSNEQQLVKMCEILEPTIFEQEEMKWRIAVLEREDCPEKVSAPTTAPARPKPRPRQLDNDEISLGSEDDLDDFIVDDEERPSGPRPSRAGAPAGVAETSKTHEALRNKPTVEASEREQQDRIVTEEEQEGEAQAHSPPREATPTTPRPAPVEEPLPEQLPITPPLADQGAEDEADGDDIVTALQKLNRRKAEQAKRPPDLQQAALTYREAVQPSTRAQRPPSSQIRGAADVAPGTPIIDLTGDDDESVSQRRRDQRSSTTNVLSVNGSGKLEIISKATTPRKDTTSEDSPRRRQTASTHLDPSNLPDVQDPKAILQYTPRQYEKKKAQDCLLAHVIYTMPKDERERLDTIVGNPTLTKKQFRKAVTRGVSFLADPAKPKSAGRTYSGEELLGFCAMCFYNSRDFYGRPETITGRYANQTFIRLKKNYKPFFPLILRCLEVAHSRADELENFFAAAKQANDLSSEDDVQGDGNEASPHRPKRKRHVPESWEALANQRSAQRRVGEQQKQQQLLAKKLEREGISNEDPSRQAVSFDPELYLHPHIGRRVKPHQLQGIQFLFRELVKDKKHQGALLAHTMGLGKTMQVISFLVTVALVGVSSEEAAKYQIPEQLRKSRTLILCPSSLIDNWWEECMMWIPQESHVREAVGEVRRITALSLPTERLHELRQWYENGGIFLLSYDLFREYIHNKARRLSEISHRQIREYLLDGPNVIVADEAHKIKNRSSGLAEACSLFRSTSRIALTGSPLSNHLEDYYAMIDWIAPGYLGDFVQFKVKYMEPIEDGLYADSDLRQKRISLKKLAVLKKDLDPKVQRADIAAISDDLPPKAEFVITVPLTALQREAYQVYIESLRLERIDDVAQTRLWDYLAILSLLCNHPACFKKKLEERESRDWLLGHGEDRSGSDEEAPPATIAPEDPAVPSAVSSAVSQVVPQRATERLGQLFRSVSDVESIQHSYRTVAVDMIIQASIEAGDKVLIFSHSIPTLDYLEKMLKEKNRVYSRLDGKTPMGVRQAATKSFNMQGSPTQVYLISMRAGGLGLNIPGANRVVIFDFSFNPSWEEQAVGRAYRLRQKKPVFVYRFVAGGTFEDVIHNKAIFKAQLSSRVVDKKAPIAWASKSVKDYLFPPIEVLDADLSDFMGKDPKVLDGIIARGVIRKIDLTETFQRESNETLTPSEQKEIEEELANEQLKRNDPAAWQRKLQEIAAGQARQAQLEQQQRLQILEGHATQHPVPQLPLIHSPRLPENTVDGMTITPQAQLQQSTDGHVSHPYQEQPSPFPGLVTAPYVERPVQPATYAALPAPEPTAAPMQPLLQPAVTTPATSEPAAHTVSHIHPFYIPNYDGPSEDPTPRTPGPARTCRQQ